MMTIINVCICVTLCIVLAFWVGKKIGQSRVFKLEKKMEDYENMLNTMQAGFDKVVDVYIKDLEKHTEEIKELLIIADKKCLSANDLLAEIDIGIDDIKRRNLSGDTLNTVVNHNNENIKALKQEIKNALDEVYERIGKLDKTLQTLKRSVDSPSSSSSSLSEEDVKTIVNTELSVYLDAMGLKSNGDDIEKLTEKYGANNKTTLNRYEYENSSYSSIKSQYNNNGENETKETDSILVEPVNSANILPSDRLNSSVSKERTKEIIAKIAKKDISYVRQEVLKLYFDGMSIPQIAREMRIGTGEAQMIVNLFGGRSEIK